MSIFLTRTDYNFLQMTSQVIRIVDGYTNIRLKIIIYNNHHKILCRRPFFNSVTILSICSFHLISKMKIFKLTFSNCIYCPILFHFVTTFFFFTLHFISHVRNEIHLNCTLKVKGFFFCLLAFSKN